MFDSPARLTLASLALLRGASEAPAEIFKLTEDRTDLVVGYVHKAAYELNLCVRLVYDWKKYSQMS